VFRTTARISEHRVVAPEHVRMRLHVPEVAAAARPGQFVYVRCGQTLDPLLSRPFSIAGVDPSAGTVDVIFQTVGRGTALLAALQAGVSLELVGPLGHGFELPPRRNPAVLIGGGVGVPPLMFLAERLAADGVPVAVLIGARSAELLLGVAEFEACGAELQVATDDGSAGYHGFPTALLEQHLAQDPDCEVYACGPHELLRTVADLTLRADVPCQVCLENQMGCGLGACLGCVVAARTADGGEEYLRVCKDGPVFDARRVVW